MLKKLKSGLFLSIVEKQLERARIDRTHDFIQPKQLSLLTNYVVTPKQKNQLLNLLYKGINSSDNILRIKSLIVFHACIRKYFDEQFCEMIMNFEVDDDEPTVTKTQRANIQIYITKNVVNFYIVYLKKLCLQRQSFIFMKNFNKQRYKTEVETESSEQLHNRNLEIVNHGFKILNIIYYIFQSQQMFNKMGRYHIEYEQILNLYMQLLEDIDLFNNFLKTSVKEIIQKNNQVKMSFSNCRLGPTSMELIDISLKKNNIIQSKKQKILTSSTKVQSSSINITKQNPKLNHDEAEETKHYFLYINETQKVSDRLYEFYHNRYYYKILKGIINFPTFLVIQNKQYSKLKNKTKKVDRNLVHLVKMSKYDSEKTIADHNLKTEPSYCRNKLNSTVSYGKRVITEADQNSLQLAFDNMTMDFAQHKIEQTIEEDNEF